MVKHLKFTALSLTNLLQNNNKVDSLLSNSVMLITLAPI